MSRHIRTLENISPCIQLLIPNKSVSNYGGGKSHFKKYKDKCCILVVL